jgi:hypothetical protein
VALLCTKVSILRKANKSLSKRRRAKKARIRNGGSLNIQEAVDLLDQKASDKQVIRETRQNNRSAGRARMKIPCCGVCGKPGHNMRTCQEAIESSDSAASTVVIADS